MTEENLKDLPLTDLHLLMVQAIQELKWMYIPAEDAFGIKDKETEIKLIQQSINVKITETVATE